jgi:hypothetical protein
LNREAARYEPFPYLVNLIENCRYRHMTETTEAISFLTAAIKKESAGFL